MERIIFICLIILGIACVFFGIRVWRINSNFYIKEFTKSDEIFQRIKGKSYKDDCIVPVSDLRYVHILHRNFEGRTCEGEMIVNKHIAGDVVDVFKELYKKGYRIEQVKLIDDFNADDERTMEMNNTSSFNFRFIGDTKKVSKHGYGLALDVNPLYNPYYKKKDTGEEIIEPITAKRYVDREGDFDHKIDENDLCYKVFIKHGFEWGGNWKSCKDYQDFEVPDEFVEKYYKD